MKEPADKPKPTFCGHKMKWVGSELPSWTGSFWKWKSEDGKVTVRAWPAQNVIGEPFFKYLPEVNIQSLHIDVDGWFEGNYKTHKELLRLLRRAEQEVLRRYKKVAGEYKILLDVIGPKQ